MWIQVTNKEYHNPVGIGQSSTGTHITKTKIK